jgi:hypothetical protein
MGVLLSEYLFLEEASRIPLCDKIAAGLSKTDLETSLKQIYEFWLSAGCDTKKKIIMAPCCIYGSDSFILELKKQIEEWTKLSRGALASFVVFCIALNGGSVALLMVDAYTVKAPNNQVKNTAKEAFAFAAGELGVTLDELSDRIVPDFGFDRKGEKMLDYGARVFRLILESDFSLSVIENESGKALKSLPAPSAKDDKDKAGEAKKIYTELKKSIKAVVQNQSFRLERILTNGRKWNASAWKKLFVDNPLMRRFALALVWGAYSAEGKLLQCFRYMEDGSFNTAGEENYTLPDDALITLAHPIEMGSEAVEAWKTQLADYEINQPFAQLASPVLTIGENEKEGNFITRYRAKTTTAGKLTGLSKKFNMRRGEIMDGGSYNNFILEDDYLKAGALISFEYMYMGMDPSEQVALEDLIFYRIDDEGNSPLSYGSEITNEDAAESGTLPPRYISGVLAIFDRLLQGGEETEPLAVWK